MTPTRGPLLVCVQIYGGGLKDAQEGQRQNSKFMEERSTVHVMSEQSLKAGELSFRFKPTVFRASHDHAILPVSAKLGMDTRVSTNCRRSAREDTYMLPPYNLKIPSLLNQHFHSLYSTINMYSITITLLSVFFLTNATYAILPPAQNEASMINLLSSDYPVPPSESLLSNVKLNASSLLNVSAIKIDCFNVGREFRPTSLFSFYEAVQQILLRNDAMVPRQFFLGPKSEDQWKWAAGSGEYVHKCTITFANLRPLLTDKFPIILVAHIAALITDKCVTEEEKFMGGWASAGPGRGVVAVSNVDKQTQ